MEPCIVDPSSVSSRPAQCVEEGAVLLGGSRGGPGRVEGEEGVEQRGDLEDSIPTQLFSHLVWV